MLRWLGLVQRSANVLFFFNRAIIGTAEVVVFAERLSLGEKICWVIDARQKMITCQCCVINGRPRLGQFGRKQKMDD